MIDPPTPPSFGERVKRLRRLLDLTQAELAKRAGCARVTIHKIESNDLRPSKQLAELLAQALLIPAAERESFVELARGAQAAAERPASAQIDVRPPTNLPVQLTSFIGRTEEIAAVKRLLAGTRLLTLTGSGGTGKTRLSLRVAAGLLDQYADGVWFVELAPLADATLVPQTVASTLGVREEIGRPMSDTLTDYLREKQLLLLLDNCEHLIEACARFADLLLHAAPRLKILASSREALGITGELAWRVPSLPTPNPSEVVTSAQLEQYAAVQLFIERASFAHPTFAVTNANAPAVAQLCYQLDGIPLAIELAAARVKALRVEQIAARLDDRFRLLTGGSRTALPRQQTLRGAIDWSYALLSEPERVLLRRLSVFAGGWTLEAAEAVCSDEIVTNPSPVSRPAPEHSLPQADILDLLGSLLNKSLVVLNEQSAEPRYRMLETIRQYAREKLLDSSGGERVRDRHLDYYMTLSEEAEPNLLAAQQVVWHKRLAMEHDNLRAALDWSQEGGYLVGGLRLAGALPYFWFRHDYQTEAVERSLDIISRSAKAEQTTKNMRARAKALNSASFLLGWPLDKHAEARPLLEEALAIGRKLGDKQTMAQSLSWLGGVVLIGQGDYAAARSLVEQSLGLWRELQNKREIGVAALFFGDIALHQEDYEQAQLSYEESIALELEIGDLDSQSYLYRRLGYLALRRNDSRRASELFKRGLEISREGGDRQASARYLGAFGAVAAMRGQTLRAVQLFGASQAQLETTHAKLFSADRIEHEHHLATLSSQLNEATFSAAWAEGRALTLEQAVALALE